MFLRALGRAVKGLQSHTVFCLFEVLFCCCLMGRNGQSAPWWLYLPIRNECEGSDAPLHADSSAPLGELPLFTGGANTRRHVKYFGLWKRQERHGAVKTFPHTLMAHSHRKQAKAFSSFKELKVEQTDWGTPRHQSENTFLMD